MTKSTSVYKAIDCCPWRYWTRPKHTMAVEGERISPYCPSIHIAFLFSLLLSCWHIKWQKMSFHRFKTYRPPLKISLLVVCLRRIISLCKSDWLTLLENPETTTSSSTKRDSKTLICQPDEKTFVEDTEDAGKTLVESLTTSPAATAGTSLDQVSIRFSNDFSSLVDHFSALRERLDSEKLTKNDEKALVDSSSSSSNDNDSRSAHEEEETPEEEEERKHLDETIVKQQCDVQDKLQVESDDNNHTSSSSPNTTASQPAILVVSNDNTPPMHPSIESQCHHHYYHQHMHSMPTSPLSACVATPRSRMSTTSRRSRRPSTLSKKSSKSSRYFAKHKKESSTVEYTARSYDEMMRIPDPRERLAFYEKTFKQCMRADSKLTSWMKRVKEKGLPKPMTEGNIVIYEWMTFDLTLTMGDRLQTSTSTTDTWWSWTIQRNITWQWQHDIIEWIHQYVS